MIGNLIKKQLQLLFPKDVQSSRCYTNDVRTTALNVVVTLLSMQGQKALGFHKKYLGLCSEDEQRSYGFGMILGWVINDRIFIFAWTIPLIVSILFSLYQLIALWIHSHVWRQKVKEVQEICRSESHYVFIVHWTHLQYFKCQRKCYFSLYAHFELCSYFPTLEGTGKFRTTSYWNTLAKEI